MKLYYVKVSVIDGEYKVIKKEVEIEKETQKQYKFKRDYGDSYRRQLNKSELNIIGCGWSNNYHSSVKFMAFCLESDVDRIIDKCITAVVNSIILFNDDIAKQVQALKDAGLWSGD